MIQVYYYHTAIFDKALFDEYISLLPATFRQDILRYKFEKERINRLITRLLLRKALMATGNSTELLHTYTRDPQNKPYIKDWLSFNLSYSNEYVVFAFTGLPVIGIDIEQVSEMDIDPILQWFCPEEVTFINGAANPHESFYNTWVKKEAILKATGQGIVGGLNQVNCLGNKVWYKNNWWYWQALPVAPGYICYLSVPQEHVTITITAVTQDSLLR